MSLKNYIFASINTKDVAPVAAHQQRLAGNGLHRRAALGLPTVPEDAHHSPTMPHYDFTLLKKLWSYVSVEPVIICWLLPSCFLFIALENLALEKVHKALKKHFL